MNKFILKIAKYYWTFICGPLFRHNRPKSPPKRILITRFDGLGDFFLLIPFFQKLVNHNYEIVCISPAINNQIINHLSIPLTFIPFDNSTSKAFKKALSYVRKTEFSFACNLSMNIWGGFLVNQSKSSIKAGLLQETDRYIYKGSNLFYDRTFSYVRNLHSFEVLRNVFTEITHITDFESKINAISSDNNSVVLHPFATWKPRQWPRFNELFKALLSRNYIVRVIGTAEELNGFEIPKEIREHNQFSIAALTSVDQLMGEIDQCKAFIGNDSGPVHYAALTGKASTVIWGPGFFERIHPIGKNVHFCILPAKCRPCRQKGETCKEGDNYCLKDISVDMVVGAFEKSLEALQGFL